MSEQAEAEKTAKLLERGAEFLKLGKCEGIYAVNALGKSVSSDDKSACAWCVQGAVMAASVQLGSSPDTMRSAYNALEDLYRRDHGKKAENSLSWGIPFISDHMTQAEAVDWLNRTAQEVRGA